MLPKLSASMMQHSLVDTCMQFQTMNYGCNAAGGLVGYQDLLPGPCQFVSADAVLNPKFQELYFALDNGEDDSLFMKSVSLTEDM